jgi:hypothetical protein
LDNCCFNRPYDDQLREPFDYTKWQRNLYEGIFLDDFLNDAANFRQDAKNNKPEQA